MSEGLQPVVVRFMTKSDVPAVMDVDRLSLPTPWAERSFQYELTENPASCLLLAEQQGENSQIVGFVGFWMLVDEAHISTLGVHPEHRQKGIGTQLLLEAIRQGIAMGARLVTLEVRQSNQSAINLYRKHGFEVVGKKVRYYMDNQEDAILMSLRDLRERIAAVDGGVE
jgi:ribosomal-protein-alanine N-acetyltransferase